MTSQETALEEVREQLTKLERQNRSVKPWKVLTVIAAASILLLSLANTALFWVLIPLAGCLAQGVGTLVVASAVQVKSIAAYAGTALGLIGGLANFGGFVLPLVGGRLAEVNQTWPFILWAAAALAGTVCLFMLREQPRGSKQQPI